MKIKILIAGIGGVGGFLGAKLAARAENDSRLEVYFLCRGKHLDNILKSGLLLEEPENNTLVKPFAASDTCKQFPEMDFVLICCKSFDLEAICQLLKPCVTPQTLLIPFMNGLDHDITLKHFFPDARTANGCIYIVSHLKSPGIIQMKGTTHSLLAGSGNAEIKTLREFSKICQASGIHLTEVNDIEDRIWKKFSFISPLATFTSVYRINASQILHSGEHTRKLKTLMQELLELTHRMGVKLPVDMIEQNFLHLSRIPGESTTSMERDISLGKPSEFETLTGTVVRKAKQYGLYLPYYSELYGVLSENKKT